MYYGVKCTAVLEFSWLNGDRSWQFNSLLGCRYLKYQVIYWSFFSREISNPPHRRLYVTSFRTILSPYTLARLALLRLWFLGQGHGSVDLALGPLHRVIWLMLVCFSPVIAASGLPGAPLVFFSSKLLQAALRCTAAQPSKTWAYRRVIGLLLALRNDWMRRLEYLGNHFYTVHFVFHLVVGVSTNP